jgi:hypothetical protein
VFEVRWLCIFSKNKARERRHRLSFGIGLIGKTLIGGNGESMGKRAFLWAKDFIGGG